MAYEKHTWSHGETISADLLNHMEEGIAEGGQGGGIPLIVEVAYDSENNCSTLQSTWQEIFNAFKAGGCIIHDLITTPLGTSESLHNILGIYYMPTPGGVEYTIATDDKSYTCTSPNDYPTNYEYDGGDDEPFG